MRLVSNSPAGSVRADGAGVPGVVSRLVDLIVEITWRDIRVRYKQSLLGIAWAVLLPLVTMLVFVFVFTRAVSIAETVTGAVPYALFAYCGLVPWLFFASSLTGCANCLVANRTLVTKVYFSREVFPISAVLVGLVDFVIATAALAAMMYWFAQTSSWQPHLTAAVAFVPVLVIVQAALTLGVGMVLAMANLFYRDVRQAVAVGVNLLMFVSGVVVPVPDDGSMLSAVLRANPMVWIIQSYRDCLLHGRWPSSAGALPAVLVSIVVLVGGWVWFRRASSRFAECI